MEVILLNTKLKRWIARFEQRTIAKIEHVIEQLEQYGPELGLPQSKSLGHRLFELRIYGDQPVRIFYAFHHGQAVLLHGCVKKSYRLERRELDVAWRLLKQLD